MLVDRRNIKNTTEFGKISRHNGESKEELRRAAENAISEVANDKSRGEAVTPKGVTVYAEFGEDGHICAFVGAGHVDMNGAIIIAKEKLGLGNIRVL